MEQKVDYKKRDKQLYLPPKQPTLMEVPRMGFFMVDGKGAPQGEQYQNALQALYAVTFTIKMSKMGVNRLEGYFEYVVPPLEGLWWNEGGPLDITSPKEGWLWTSMIRQPEFVTQKVFAWAQEEVRRKKPSVDASNMRFAYYEEGLCATIMHIGPYSEETQSMEKMHAFMQQNGLMDDTGEERKHHEIYLSDPRRTAPERLKTVLRIPVKKKAK
ncbi:GyrI-like domain-containing protein [Clostridia bacterium OttesenSCG-928-F22]|nr:GyrI-like domain-containing protein [Clostridia bacterium OttesenSCG-928-F22]